MVNINRLKGKIVEQGLTIQIISNQLGVSKSTLYRKLRGQCQFTIQDADSIANILKLSASEATLIFFSQYVA